VNKPNRAHYRVDTSIGTGGGWKPTDKLLCVFHARRMSRSGYRPTVLVVGPNCNSRPVEQFCTDCLNDHRRCEHDVQNYSCPKIPGDSCGRDSDKELGGSW
jgi:hypothetical protein